MERTSVCYNCGSPFPYFSPVTFTMPDGTALCEPGQVQHYCAACSDYLTHLRLPAVGITTISDSDTAGYAGYNQGLGVEIKDRGHWKQVVRETNSIPVG